MSCLRNWDIGCFWAEAQFLIDFIIDFILDLLTNGISEVWWASVSYRNSFLLVYFPYFTVFHRPSSSCLSVGFAQPLAQLCMDTGYLVALQHMQFVWFRNHNPLGLKRWELSYFGRWRCLEPLAHWFRTAILIRLHAHSVIRRGINVEVLPGSGESLLNIE